MHGLGGVIVELLGSCFFLRDGATPKEAFNGGKSKDTLSLSDDIFLAAISLSLPLSLNDRAARSSQEREGERARVSRP